MSFAKRALENLPEYDRPIEVVEVEPAFDTVRFMAAFQPHQTPESLRQLRHEGWLDDTEVGVKLFEGGYGVWHCDNIDEYEGWHKAQTAATAYNRKMEFAA